MSDYSRMLDHLKGNGRSSESIYFESPRYLSQCQEKRNACHPPSISPGLAYSSSAFRSDGRGTRVLLIAVEDLQTRTKAGIIPVTAAGSLLQPVFSHGRRSWHLGGDKRAYSVGGSRELEPLMLAVRGGNGHFWRDL